MRSIQRKVSKEESADVFYRAPPKNPIRFIQTNLSHDRPIGHEKHQSFVQVSKKNSHTPGAAIDVIDTFLHDTKECQSLALTPRVSNTSHMPKNAPTVHPKPSKHFESEARRDSSQHIPSQAKADEVLCPPVILTDGQSLDSSAPKVNSDGHGLAVNSSGCPFSVLNKPTSSSDFCDIDVEAGQVLGERRANLQNKNKRCFEWIEGKNSCQ